jgi:AcrR family transcriptional regulator
MRKETSSMANGPAERARLLREAQRYVLDHGMVGLSLSQLARGVESSNRMLLYHFGSLDNILSLVVDDILEHGPLLPRLREVLQQEDSPGRPEDRLKSAWRHISSPDCLPHLCIFFARLGMAVDDPVRFSSFLVATRTRWTELVHASLERDGLDEHETAQAVVALWRGLQVLLVSGEEVSVVNRVHDQAIVALLSGNRANS